MDFDLLKEGASEVFLVMELLHENTIRIYLFQVLDDADFLPLIDLLVVLEKLLDNFFKHALLGSVF